MSDSAKKLFVLTGPTAVGKTELALQWAEQNNAEILSCDSLLFYRGMDIGTAKPTAAERARVPHHLLDIAEVDERVDVALYLQQARSAIAAIQSAGKQILVVGGSGFYLRSFFAPIVDEVDVPAELRAEIGRKLETLGLENLVDELNRLNPGGIGKLDTQNPRRVVRALERCEASGLTLTELAQRFAAQPAPFSGWDIDIVCLEREKPVLETRIQQRVEAMLSSGLVEETQLLLTRGLRQNASASRAIGYRETIAMLDGELSQAELMGAIVSNTRALVKKQRTWFRTQLPSHRVVPANTATASELFRP